MAKPPSLPEPPLPELRVAKLDASSEAVLQRFFYANPAYFLTTTGQAARPTDAFDELNDTLPDGWAFSAVTLVGYFNAEGALAAMANVVSDLFAPGIWHISTFIVETARHGQGDAQAIYDGLERWAAKHGANFMRLGVVLGNARAERFWEKQGYLQTRLRHGVELGGQINTLRVMCKPLSGGTLGQFLQMVERDRPEPQGTTGR
ncbi:GNAT family N-acetyltransferase [Ideonella margarita]|uniref:GNAT family N-acetyltransferase n=1 Tax=Ideonella margarita TaxID=2984191 RepID=A0ABU9CBZ2_9BURK